MQSNGELHTSPEKQKGKSFYREEEFGRATINKEFFLLSSQDQQRV